MTRRAILVRSIALPLLGVAVAHGQIRREIRDRQGRLLGTVTGQRNGMREARDRQGRLLGSYNPRTDETRDRQGRLLTKGDTLSALILENVSNNRSKP